VDSAALASLLFKIPEKENYMVMYKNYNSNSWEFFLDYPYGNINSIKQQAKTFSKHYKTRVVEVCRYIPFGAKSPLIVKIIAEFDL